MAEAWGGRHALGGHNPEGIPPGSRRLPVVVGSHRGLASPNNIQPIDVGVMVLIECDGISPWVQQPSYQPYNTVGGRAIAR